MSRGGLLLRTALSGSELDDGQVSQAARHGPGPARLDPKTRVPGGGRG